MRELCAMLPHDTPSGRPMKMSKIEHQAIALVLEKPSGRIYRSTNRAATPAGRDGEGAVKRDLPGFRVLSFSFHVLLIVCLFLLHAALPAAAQSTSNENKSKDEGKREEAKEVKKDDVRKKTAAPPSSPAERSISMSTSRSSTSPSPTLTTAWSPASKPTISACLRTASSRKSSPSPPKMCPFPSA